ncbi:MAG: HD domain-containing protein [Akkermansia sp.]
MSPAAPRRKRNEMVHVQAIIYMGASSLSMLVAQREDGADLLVLDQLSQPLDLSKEIFRSGKISRQAMARCAKILDDYLALIEEYKLAGPVEVHLLGSNIFMDVENIDTLINRLSVSSGLRLQVMDDGEMTRVLYLQTQRVLSKYPELKKKRVLVLHMGPGNTRVMSYEQGRIKFYARYRMGTSRMVETLHLNDSLTKEEEHTLIRSHIRGALDQLVYDCEESCPDKFDALLFLTPEFKSIKGLADENATVSLEQITAFTKDVASCSTSKRINKFGLDYANVFTLLPSLTFIKQASERLSSSQIIIGGHDRQENYMVSLMPTQAQRLILEKEVLHFASLLADRYRADPDHGKQVSKLSSKLFDELQDLHQLDHHDRLLLNAASILHEIGTFINPKQHHQHSQYIILNSELFGLSRLDVEIVGLLARYHRHGAPNTRKRFFAELEERDRMRVQKLSALLRVADAMESAHNARIGDFQVLVSGKSIDLVVPKMQDLTMENLALASKGDLFTDIFGYEIRLKAALD